MKIEFEESKHRAAAYDDAHKKVVGVCTFSNSQGLWIIDHTQVDEGMKGEGLGKQLVDRVVEEARGNRVKVLPLCPFAKRLFDENPDQYNDVYFGKGT